jgi:hypothetical protein
MRTTLKTTQLGGTGMEITRVGFGARALGGGDIGAASLELTSADIAGIEGGPR